MTVRRMFAALVALVVALGLSSCAIGSDKQEPKAGSGSIKQIAELKGAKLRVGSKEFDEQLVLGQIALVALRAAGASPVDKTNITGSENVRRALTGDEIDLYWEYTGTGWVDILKQTKVFPDPAQLFSAVTQADAKNGIVWWSRSPANDTYAIAGNPDAVKQNKIESLSDYAALAKSKPSEASICVGPEFKSRDDGFPGVEKKYGFTLPAAQTRTVNDSIVYPTVGKGESCNFGSVASTDGRVAANKLVVLKDDKSFFPVYNPAITIRQSIAKKYPQLEKVFDQIASKLTSQVLTDLNKKVSVDGEKVTKVATDWMKQEGFVS